MRNLERHLFVILLWVATGVSFFAHISSSSDGMPVALGLIAGVAVWVHGIHKVHRWDSATVTNMQSIVASAGLILGFGALVLVDASYLFMLFGVYSFIFGFSNNVRTAAWLSGVLTVLWIAAWVGHGLPTGAIATPIFVWGVANAIHVLSNRISTQNAERGQLIERLNATRDELAVAERERGVLAERQRISREIHDTLAQGFTSVVLLSEAMQKQLDTLPLAKLSESLALLSSTARENLDEARRLVAAEGPAALDDRSLDSALEALAENVRRQTNATVDVVCPPRVSFGGSEDVVLLRVAQEACNNIVKYADATHVEVELATDAQMATIRIADNGRGFDPDNAPDHHSSISGGSGLGFMADRVADLDGSIDIASTVGKGTTVTASVPIVTVAS